MLKFGVTNITQKNKTFLNRDKKISITLYEGINNLPNADELAERILLSFSDERGAYKRTYQKRFETFDTQIIKILKKLFSSSQSLSLNDVGVSDGRTALDFYEKIATTFSHIHYFASDYNPSVYLLEKGKLKVTLSHTGKVLEIMFPPFVFNKIKRDSFLYYPLNHSILLFIEHFFVNSLVRRYHQGLISARELILFAPKVIQKSQEEDQFCIGQHDLLKPFENSANIIRAMNVLNPSYFSEIEFDSVIQNLYQGLEEEGILITGSNQEANSLVHGGLYQKSAGKFKKIFHSGEGSPIEPLILRFKA